MTTEQTTTEQTPAPASSGSLWYVATPAEFAAMSPDERTAALARSDKESNAYLARELAKYAQAAATPSTPSTPSTSYTSTSPQEEAIAQHGRDVQTELRRLAQAEGVYNKEHKMLFRGDGTPKYAPPEQAERLAGLQATLDDVLTRAQTVIGEAIANHQNLIQHAETADPLDSLTATETTAASAKAVFITEDVKAMSAADLIAHCKYALDGRDKPTLYVLHRAVSQRVQALNTEIREGRMDPTRADMTLEQRKTLQDLATQMRDKVRGPGGKRLADAAREGLTSAQEARKKTVAVYDAAHGTKGKVEASLRATGIYSI